MKKKGRDIRELVALIKSAAEEAANFQNRFAAEDVEARKIVTVMEQYLRERSRIVYGGAAINAYMSPKTKFYDPRLYLPDYDFMTPDPLQDCADLIADFQREGFQEVEAKLGIHEGTYKIFVNYRPAADITYMPPSVYETTLADSVVIDGIRYASPDFLRMNMYLELSRPQGNLLRWTKVYERLLLLNRQHPMKVGRCGAWTPTDKQSKSADTNIIDIGVQQGAIFLSGASQHINGSPDPNDVQLMVSTDAPTLVSLLSTLGLKAQRFEALGELVPARTELKKGRKLVAVVFESVACDAYVTLGGRRVGSLDLLIHMYYGMHFAGLTQYVPMRLACVIHELIELESSRRAAATSHHAVFPLECAGHQPQMPELKRAHRKRVNEKRDELARILGDKRDK